MISLRHGLVLGTGLILLTFAPLRADDESPGQPARASDLDQKLKSVFVSIDFTNATIDDAIRALAIVSKQQDPDHRGISFIIQPEVTATAKPVTLKLDNVPLGVGLRYVCLLSGVHYKVDNRLVTIAPQPGGQELVKRTFQVEPSFVASLHDAGVIPEQSAP
jgi:hypothetical protein